MDINGKRVIITGGAVRVGAALCRAFASAGARVAVHCNSSLDEAHELCDELGGSANGHTVVQADLGGDPDAVAKMIFQQVPDAEILVNNASVFNRASMLDETYDESLMQYKINFFAPIALMREFARRRLECGGGGVVVNMTDQAVSGVSQNSFSYLLSKKMLSEAVKLAALELAPAIRVIGVAPGPVIAPPGLEHLGMRETLKRVPLGRKVELDDLVKTVLFAVSNESMTGCILNVDCGQSLC